MFLDIDEMKKFRERAKQFFKTRPELLNKLKRGQGTMLWRSKELAQFDRFVFDGSSAASY